MLNNVFSLKSRAVYEIMSKTTVEPERPQMTIWRRVACWIGKATRTQVHTPTHTRIHASTRTPPLHTHAQKYVRLLAFAQQNFFREDASILRYTYIDCLVFSLLMVSSPLIYRWMYEKLSISCLSSIR